jgi:hypothetical protein
MRVVQGPTNRIRAPLGAQNPGGIPPYPGPNPRINFGPGWIRLVIWKPTNPGRRNPSPLFPRALSSPPPESRRRRPVSSSPVATRSRSAPPPPRTAPPPPLCHLRRRASPRRVTVRRRLRAAAPLRRRSLIHVLPLLRHPHPRPDQRASPPSLSRSCRPPPCTRPYPGLQPPFGSTTPPPRSPLRYPLSSLLISPFGSSFFCGLVLPSPDAFLILMGFQ